MAAPSAASKQRLLTTLDLLPENALKEVFTFVDYSLYKQERSAKATPFKPIALGGLWENVSITDEDIAEVRQEMWRHFGELN